MLVYQRVGGNLTNSRKDLWVFVDKSMLKPVKNRNFWGAKNEDSYSDVNSHSGQIHRDEGVLPQIADNVIYIYIYISAHMEDS